jgi:hypothetical protein
VFTPTNWQTPQTVTIAGVDDDQVDGDTRFAIIISPMVSNDPYFNGVDPADIAVVNFDVEPDSDDDGFADAVDAFPSDPLEHRDTDGDGIGDRVDDDDDADGIPDGYEITYKLDHLNAADRLLDPDDDNLNNWEEYLYSGDPFLADEDADRDGTPDIADSAADDPANNGKLKLLQTAKSLRGKYGNGFGKNRYFSVIMFTFEANSEDLLLGAVGFDIDTADEITVMLNGQSIGNMSVTENKRLATRESKFYIPIRSQQAGTNFIQFIQKTPGFMWGVTEVSLNRLSMKTTTLSLDKKEQRGFGARFSADNASPVERFIFELDANAFTQPYQLSLKAFGIGTEGDARVYVNDKLVGVLRSTKGAQAKKNRIALPLDVLRAENVIEIVQNEPGESWGVTDLKISSMQDIARGRFTGYNRRL